MTEKQLTSQIIEFLNYSGTCFCWRVNSGMMPATYQGKSRMVRMAAAGTSDIQGIISEGVNKGKLICFEVKLPGKEKTLTELQQTYLEKMKGYGALCAVVTDPHQALDQVIQFLLPY